MLTLLKSIVIWVSRFHESYDAPFCRHIQQESSLGFETDVCIIVFPLNIIVTVNSTHSALSVDGVLRLLLINTGWCVPKGHGGLNSEIYDAIAGSLRKKTWLILLVKLVLRHCFETLFLTQSWGSSKSVFLNNSFEFTLSSPSDLV